MKDQTKSGDRLSAFHNLSFHDGYKKPRITSPELDHLLSTIKSLLQQFQKQTFYSYSQSLKYFYTNHNQSFIKINKIVSQWDVLLSNAKMSQEYSCVRPHLIFSNSRNSNQQKEENVRNPSNQDSRVFSEDLRHLIVERVHSSDRFVGNNLELGFHRNVNVNGNGNGNGNEIEEDKRVGILLYSPNSCGKTVYAKSVALAVIMAQSGMFVPAKQFYLTPFRKIITRMVCDDNLYEGKSSFVVEMSEIVNIVKRSDSQTLIIGDELCRGTETPSAVGIMVATIKYLVEKKSKFVFSSHVHELVRTKELTSLVEKNIVSIKHFQVIYDDIKHKLLYDRKLKDGSGSALYGIEIAKALAFPSELVNIAKSVRKEFLNQPNLLVEDKRSKWNKQVVVERCILCGKEEKLETHHIIERREKLINESYNLVILCVSCHHQIHNIKRLMFKS